MSKLPPPELGKTSQQLSTLVNHEITSQAQTEFVNSHEITECERIRQKLSLPSGVFKEEIKCDFLVETFRKKLWIVELDLLLEIDRVCKKYNIRYYLFWGTLLGAVRHNGFIPWDDDIDIIMSRTDYEEFIKHGDEFNDPYFLQNCHTDKDFYFVHSRLRNSNTAAIQRPFACRDFNHGIFVDILYFDDFDIDQEGKMVWDKLSLLISKISTYMKLNNPYPNQKDRERIALYDGENPDKLFNHIQELSQHFNKRNAKYVASTSAVVYGMNKSCFLKEDFSSTLMIDFEGFQFPIPIGWERILRTTYGDYMKLPSAENRGKWHGSLWYAPEQSYKSIKAGSQYMKWLKKDY